jgi:HlyD family secretion protein
MNRKYFYAVLLTAAACLFLIIFAMWDEGSEERRHAASSEQSFLRPSLPFQSYITGVGIVEAGSENIFIGSPFNRIVDEVLVTVGMEVEKGSPVLRFESRDLQEDLAGKQIGYDIALAKILRLESLPRTEDVSASESVLRVAQIHLSEANSELERALAVADSGAISREEVNRRRFNQEKAEAKFLEAQVETQKIKAGPWQPDLAIARLEAEQAKANIDRSRAEIERTIVRSPIDGSVLQVNIHKGELPSLDTSRTPLMVIGDTQEKYLRVSVNQFNVARFRSESPAVALLQGTTKETYPPEFLRLDPYLFSKQNFTNDILEKMDTRVFNVLYRFKDGSKNIFIGQQMDVFIEAKALSNDRGAER